MNILDRALGVGLGLVDKINIWLSPFQPFTRAIVDYDNKTLYQKDAYFWQEIQDHWLYGYNKELYWSMSPNDGGDMAIWHGVYTATCALRGDATALGLALEGSAVLQGHSSSSGIRTQQIDYSTLRLVRGATNPGGPLSIDPTRTYYKRVVDGRAYSVLADVSESSIIGHVFGLWMAYRYGDSANSNMAAQMLQELANTVAADGDQLLNPDGTPAQYGDLRLGLTTAPIRIAALAMLYSAAGAANHDLRFAAMADQVEQERAGAISHPETHFLWIHPWYQDIIAYMALAVLADSRPAVGLYRDALRSQWAKNKQEGNAFYTYLLELLGIPTGMAAQAAGILSEFPPVKSYGTVTGSDTAPDKFRWGWSWAKGGQWYARQPIKVWMRPPADFIWQRCPYGLDGSSTSAYNNLDFCSAYALGKRAGLL